MGRNINLVDMVGAPERVDCPACGESTRTLFDDIDVDNSCTNPEPGVFVSSRWCDACDKTIEVRIKCSAFVESVTVRKGDE
jgi:hypothetical protein